MSQKKINLRQLCFSAGIILILSAMVWLILWQISAQKNTEKIQAYVDMLYELIPDPQASVLEPRTNNTMPSLNVKNENFVAIIEVPMNTASFPVGASWNTNNKYPCRYDGSVYDGTLIIGTTNHKGQFDFVKEITVGNALYITDMTGNRFYYNVTDIQYSNHADNDVLYNNETDLTIFVKNIYALEYIILHCTASGS